MSYYDKYLKYKNKYLALQNGGIVGGSIPDEQSLPFKIISDAVFNNDDIKPNTEFIFKWPLYEKKQKLLRITLPPEYPVVQPTIKIVITGDEKIVAPPTNYKYVSVAVTNGEFNEDEYEEHYKSIVELLDNAINQKPSFYIISAAVFDKDDIKPNTEFILKWPRYDDAKEQVLLRITLPSEYPDVKPTIKRASTKTEIKTPDDYEYVPVAVTNGNFDECEYENHYQSIVKLLDNAVIQIKEQRKICQPKD
jgi:ubiquitin-protein ligase